MLTEMRFWVPNQEEEAKSEEDGDGEEQATAAKVLCDKIVSAAGLGEFAGEMIASLQNLPMIIPRGKYSFDLYADFAKLHGSTNDYKILYKDISKCFLLPKPDGNHVAYLIQLKTPLR